MRSMVNKVSTYIRNLHFIKRLSLSIGLAVVLFVIVSVTTFQWNGYKAEWNVAIDNNHIVCESIKSGSFKPNFNCDKKKFDDKYEQATLEYFCNIYYRGTATDLLEAFGCLRNESRSLMRYVWDEHLSYIAEQCVYLGAVLLILLSILNRYENEKSNGWKRLSLFLSALISIIFGSYFLSDIKNTQSLFLVISIFLLPLFILLYTKPIYTWIKDGFNADQEPSTSKVMQSPVTTNQSIQEQENLPETDTLQEAAGASTTLQFSKLNIAQDSVERKELIKSITQFMQRLYRGEVPLVYTYWVFGVVVGNVVPLILLGFLSIVNEPPLFILIISIIASVAWMWFISVAIWRSATNYNNNVKQGSICADLAKVSVFIGVGTIVVKIIFGILNRMH